MDIVPLLFHVVRDKHFRHDDALGPCLVLFLHFPLSSFVHLGLGLQVESSFLFFVVSSSLSE